MPATMLNTSPEWTHLTCTTPYKEHTHPPDKQTVAQRLTLALTGSHSSASRTFHQLLSSGPLPKAALLTPALSLSAPLSYREAFVHLFAFELTLLSFKGTDTCPPKGWACRFPRAEACFHSPSQSLRQHLAQRRNVANCSDSLLYIFLVGNAGVGSCASISKWVPRTDRPSHHSPPGPYASCVHGSPPAFLPTSAHGDPTPHHSKGP